MEEVKMSRLRQERIKRGWTAEEVAKNIGVTPAAVLHWETNRSTPAVDSAIKLARLYKVDINELFLPSITS